MIIRFVNLGDVHFESSRDQAADKGTQLGRTIATSMDGVSNVVLAVNGDLTYSGKSEQFDVASAFLQEVRQEISRVQSGVAVSIYCTPGNHDCDFADDQSARDILLTNLKAERPSSSIEKNILAPLKNYFQFVDEAPDVHGIDENCPYLFRTTVGCADAHIELVFLNSAWMSSRHERPGTLLFPLRLLNRLEEGVTRVVVIHHPPNWFKQPDAMRDVIRWLTDNADICCFGHEHVLDTSVNLNDCLRGVVYQHGGVFQSVPDVFDGAFQVFDIDPTAGNVLLRSFSWKEDHFQVSQSDQWINYAELTARTLKTRLNERFLHRLDDPEFPGVLPTQDVRLKDFFVFPDAIESLESDGNKRDKTRTIRGKDLANYLLDTRLVLLTGPDRCGKTALLRQLVLEFHSRGYIPVLFEAKRLAFALKEKGNIDNEIRRVLKEQYEGMTYEQMTQNYNEQVIALVDDFDEVFGSRVHSVDLAEKLRAVFGTQVLVASEEMAILETQDELGENIGLPGYKRLQLCDLGHKKIKELAERWLLTSASPQGQGDRDQSVEAISQIVAQVLSADFIPHHPWIVLVLLYKSVADDPMGVSDGSYGHLYQAILTSAMATEIKSRLDLNGKFTYLSLLAHRLYRDESAFISTEDMREFHREYCDAYDVGIDFQAVLDGLLQCGILRHDDGGVSFAARYSFCFFLAWYFKSKLDENDTREEVKKLLRQLYHRESANILLFLSHLTPGTWALDLILDRARELFRDSPLWNLKEDAEPILRLSSGDQAVSLPGSRPSENRDEELAEADQRRRERVDPADFDGRSLEVVPKVASGDDWELHVQEVQAAYKMIRILGQLLKNNVTSAEGKVKKGIVDEVFRLSRRMLGGAFASLGTDLEERRELALHRIELIQDESNKTQDRNKLIIRADQEVIGVCWLAGFAVVRSVAEAVGAPGLERTYRRVVEHDDALPNRLYETTILMENDSDFPRKKIESLARDLRNNWFGHALLRSLIAYHFYMFDRPFRLRQSITDKLEITVHDKHKPKETKKKPPRLIDKSRRGRGRRR